MDQLKKKKIGLKISLNITGLNKRNSKKIGQCAAEYEPFKRAEVCAAPAGSAGIASPREVTKGGAPLAKLLERSSNQLWTIPGQHIISLGGYWG